MPIYEYTCRDCGHPFETLVRSGTVPACPACPACQSQALVKRLSAPAALTTATADAAPTAALPCGACGHPAGPGACAYGPG